MAERFSTLVELCERSCARFAARPLFGTREQGGRRWTTYGEFGALVAACRAGLSALGVSAGDKVALISNNRVEWAVSAYAVYGLAAAVVPMYEAQLPSEWEFILGDSGASVVLAANLAIAARLEAAAPSLPALRHLICFDGPPEGATSFSALLERGRCAPVPSGSPTEDVTANLIYTSGTTGKPKGVILSHGNTVSNVNALHEVFLFEPDDVALSFLPWAHAFGQIELHALFSMGCALALNRDVSELLDDLAEVKPTVLVAVPRVFSRLYAAVWDQVRQRPKLVQWLFRAGLGWAKRREANESVGLGRLGLLLADALLYKRVRARFGGRLKYVICGGAALGAELGHFIDALGVRVYEGYGMTEASPIVSANSPAHRRLGSGGKVLPGVRVVIDVAAAAKADGEAPPSSEGEIVVYGSNVMKGYHNRPEESGALLADGGFRTGDLGRFDQDGYLYITGRIKEQFKLENGKYVMPGPLEDELKMSPYISNVVLYGDNKPFCVALVLLDVPRVLRWAADQGFEPRDPTRDERVRRLIQLDLERLSAGFRRFEKPLAFALATGEFTPENGMLTPTLKLKRRTVVGRYKALLDALYDAAASKRIANAL